MRAEDLVPIFSELTVEEVRRLIAFAAGNLAYRTSSWQAAKTLQNTRNALIAPQPGETMQ